MICRIILRMLMIFMVLFFSGCTVQQKTSQVVVIPVLNNNAANSYIVADQREAVVIDPAEPEKIITALTDNNLEAKYIILTHGHFDHIGGLQELMKFKPDLKIFVHPDDSVKLPDPEKNLSKAFGTTVAVTEKNLPIREGNKVKIGNTVITVIETPGHTTGSIALLAENNLFSGDTLFKGSIGRTDFPGGSSEDLKQSLQKLSSLPGDTRVYPGHGEVTVLKNELMNNPYIQNAMREE